MKTLLVFTLLTAGAVTQLPYDPACPNGICPQRAPAAVATLRLEWKLIPDTKGEQYALYRGPKQIGAWDSDGDTYRPLTASGDWDVSCKPPIASPIPAKVKPAPVVPVRGFVGPPAEANPDETLNFGLDLVKMREPRCYPICKSGVPCTYEAGMQALVDAAAKDFPDDSAKLHVTAGGSEKHRADVREKLKQAGELQRVNYQAYANNSPMLACGFPTEGDWVMVQNSANEALHLQAGADGVVEAVRKIDPNLDLKKVPNVNTPALPVDALSYLQSVRAMFPDYVWLGAGIVAFVLYRKYQKAKVVS